MNTLAHVSLLRPAGCHECSFCRGPQSAGTGKERIRGRFPETATDSVSPLRVPTEHPYQSSNNPQYCFPSSPQLLCKAQVSCRGSCSFRQCDALRRLSEAEAATCRCPHACSKFFSSGLALYCIFKVTS